MYENTLSLAAIDEIEGMLPDTPSKARIGIFGGSFDPPHICHQLMAISMLALEPIDQLWIIPCADHPFHKKLTPFHHRYAMCKLAFERFNEDIKVLDIEQRLPTPSYTVQTLATILKARPNIYMNLAVGSDLLEQIPNWHEADLLFKMAQITVFPREGFLHAKASRQITNVKIYENYILPNVKSTSIRTELKKGESEPIKRLIDRAVLAYADKNKLYLNV